MSEPALRNGKSSIVGSLCAGAMVGVIINTAQYLKGIYDVLGWQDIRHYGVGKGTWMFMATFIVWLAFLCALGGPAWRTLHRRHVRG